LFDSSSLISSAYLAIGLITLYFLIFAQSAKWRAISLLGMSLIRVFSIATAILITSGGGSSSNAQALKYWAFMEFFVVLGAVINVISPHPPTHRCCSQPHTPLHPQVLKVPERFWPGVFNFFFNSHQIMHIFSIIGLVAPRPSRARLISHGVNLPVFQTLMMRAGELDGQSGCWNLLIWDV
jgi:hypothetical protein